MFQDLKLHLYSLGPPLKFSVKAFPKAGKAEVGKLKKSWLIKAIITR